MILPVEIVNLIADYHDYDKYCLPVHKTIYRNVLDDILCMSEIMTSISANLAYQCWGNGWSTQYDIDYEIDISNDW
jgi:hypothetical protein